MNKFDAGLRNAQSRQNRLYGLLAIIIFLGGVLLTGVLLFASGTSVVVQPSEAEEAGPSVSISTGFALMFRGIAYSLSDEPVVLVSAPGFRSATRAITAADKGGTIVVYLEELPGQLTITTSPSDDRTRWSLDQIPASIGDIFEQEVTPGPHEIEINSPFFRVETRDLDIQRGATESLAVDLTAVEGTFIVNSVPTNSTIIINGKAYGQTPADIALDGGQYEVEIQNPAFKATVETIEITNSKPEIERHYTLQPLSGSLVFTVKPQGGVLLVNGKKSDATKPVTVTANVESQISYMLDGYFSQTKVVTLNANEVRKITLTLEPELGAVDVRSQPSASVYVNNVHVGDTPLLISLPAIGTTVALRKDGYRSIEKTVVPTSKRTTAISENLRTELAARLAESPRAYENSVGASLLLFEPSSFEMGAPRHEQGQRANEFQRSIKLNKPFYASTHEISVAQFAHFDLDYAKASNTDNPITSVGWITAAEFCNWLSQEEGLEPFYQLTGTGYRGVNEGADGYRLLTEPEWEWLARSASKHAQTIFSWGDSSVVPPKAGNIADETARGIARFFVPNYTDGFAKVAPVGSFPAEPSGLFDLTGNVSEWVHDYYSLQPPTTNTMEVDPLGPTYGDAHVVKGSNWQSGTRTTLRAAYREGVVGGREDIGFRIGRYLYGG